jgi:hypothetical protein
MEEVAMKLVILSMFALVTLAVGVFAINTENSEETATRLELAGGVFGFVACLAMVRAAMSAIGLATGSISMVLAVMLIGFVIQLHLLKWLLRIGVMRIRAVGWGKGVAFGLLVPGINLALLLFLLVAPPRQPSPPPVMARAADEPAW